MFRVAGRSEYLAITGLGIKDMKLAKKAWIWPKLQKYTRINVSPVNYTFNITCMSKEKLLFTIPTFFTIGPHVDDRRSLRRYAKLVSPCNAEEIVRGVVQGVTRVLAASLLIEDIFKGAEEFEHKIFDRVRLELDHFGLHIFNTDVKSLTADVEGHDYSGQSAKLARNTRLKAILKKMYRVAGPSEYLAITGLGIMNVKVAKKALIWPKLQKCIPINVSPVKYTFNITSMSKEEFLFTIPVSFTIGPNVVNRRSLRVYAKMVSRHSFYLYGEIVSSLNIQDFVRCVIDGHTCFLTSSIPMEDILKRPKEFERQMLEMVRSVLVRYGLHIYDAEIKSLIADVEGQKRQKEASKAKAQLERNNRLKAIQEKRNAEKTQTKNNAETQTKNNSESLYPTNFWCLNNSVLM